MAAGFATAIKEGLGVLGDVISSVFTDTNFLPIAIVLGILLGATGLSILFGLFRG